VVLKDSIPSQDGKDTVFGNVTSGLEILQGLPAREPSNQNQPPPLLIQSITIQKS
jgi:cyclophilin family peptidyl-prolyl cis-trans isomerase